jgi:hypothetical protein
MNHEHQHEPDNGKETISRAKWVFIGFAAIAAYFLIAEHRAHLSEYLKYWPFLLVLACPLMHLFMHGGHGGHGDDEKKNAGDRDSSHEHKHH